MIHFTLKDVKSKYICIYIYKVNKAIFIYLSKTKTKFYKSILIKYNKKVNRIFRH